MSDDNRFRKGEWVGDQWTPSDDDDELPAAPRGPGLSAGDRELLTLAARALGAQFVDVEHEGYGNLHFEDGRVVNAWNPLAFSGDAFELQVSLRLTVAVMGTEACIHYGGKEPIYEKGVENGSSLAAATRRAITRTAAEIGTSNG